MKFPVYFKKKIVSNESVTQTVLLATITLDRTDRLYEINTRLHNTADLMI